MDKDFLMGWTPQPTESHTDLAFWFEKIDFFFFIQMFAVVYSLPAIHNYYNSIRNMAYFLMFFLYNLRYIVYPVPYEKRFKFWCFLHVKNKKLQWALTCSQLYFYLYFGNFVIVVCQLTKITMLTILITNPRFKIYSKRSTHICI